ncbi:hypothetical protein SAMN05660903_03241 [Salegentibacter salinarum]|nr:hypothetical protein SAMN05660903_03241 [Salegentibacter salinarum]
MVLFIFLNSFTDAVDKDLKFEVINFIVFSLKPFIRFLVKGKPK